MLNSKGKTIKTGDNGGDRKNLDMVVELGYVKKYKLNISANNKSKEKVKVMVSENIDEKKMDNGGSWRTSKMKSDPNGKFGVIINKITFLPIDEARLLYYMTYEDIYYKFYSYHYFQI